MWTALFYERIGRLKGWDGKLEGRAQYISRFYLDGGADAVVFAMIRLLDGFALLVKYLKIPVF